MDGEVNVLLLGGGFVLGLLFGVVVQRSRFCMTAVVSNWMLLGDYRQLRAYLVAVVIALTGTQLLEAREWVAVAESSYRSGLVDWAGAIVGGLLFGFGSVFAGGCAGRVLVRTGEGDLGALLALLALALGATVTYYGVLEPARVSLMQATAFEARAGDTSLAAIAGVPWWTFSLSAVAATAGVFYATRSQSVGRGVVAGGALVGALVVAGWWVTGALAHDEFSSMRPVSLSFSGPIARTTMLLASATVPSSYFGVLLVAGVLLGSFLSAVSAGSFRWTAPESAGVSRTLGGGLLMGIGAITAGGCNIGHGLTGLSTLSMVSLIAAASIASGMYLGVKCLQRSEATGSLWNAIAPARWWGHRPV